MIYDNPRMSDDARAHLQQLVSFFQYVRSQGHDFMAMLVPVGLGSTSAAIALDNSIGLIQVAAAAQVLRIRHHPTEVLWVCDTFQRTVTPGQELPSVGPAEDPLATEAVDVGYCRDDGVGGEMPRVEHASLPYRWTEEKVEFRGDLLPWVDGTTRLDAVISTAVWSAIPFEVRLPTPEELEKLNVSLVSASDYN